MTARSGCTKCKTRKRTVLFHFLLSDLRSPCSLVPRVFKCHECHFKGDFMRWIKALSILVALSFLTTGCTTPGAKAWARANKKIVCASVGALAGGAAGAAIGHHGDNRSGQQTAAGAAIGVLVFGTAGYFICKNETPPVAPAPAPAAPAPAPAPKAAPAPAAKKIILRGVNFAFDSAEITPESQVILQSAGDVLKENPGVKIGITGHTCSIGTDEYNQGLSERRANAVLQNLVKQGIAAERLQAAGKGESQPVADNATKDGRAQNRRVELAVSE